MPNLPRPRLRRTRAGELVAPAPPEPQTPRVEEIAAEGLRWVKIDQPGPLEQAWLEENFDFHALDFEDVVSRNQRPKIDVYDDYLFIVLHIPIFDPAARRLGAGELDLFVGPDFLVTIPNQPLQPVEYLFERCRQKEEMREQLFSRGSGYLLYRLVDDGFDYCFPMLRKIGNKLDALEVEIFEGRSEEIVRDISNVKQEIINFRKVIRPQRPVLRDLERVKQRYLAPDMDLEIYFDDIVDAHERIWDMLENNKEVVEALEDTNESVISHRVNDILRVLTSISVIVLPLTFIASLWGMNVGVPGEGEETAFWIVIAAMVVILVGMLAFFRRRGWLVAASRGAAWWAGQHLRWLCGQSPDLGALAPRLREGREQGRGGGVHLLRRSRGFG
jgi:magnesium transporter